MSKEMYEATKAVRVIDNEEKEPWIFRFANIHPRSFSVGILGGYFVFLAAILGWCWTLYH